MKYRFLFMTAAAAFLCSVAFADVAIETSVSRSVLPVGEQLTLDIIISNANGRIEQPKIDSVEGFTSYSQGRSQELTIINGSSTSRSIFSYVLVANSAGTKTIGPFLVVIGGKEYKVAPVKVEVTQGGSASGAYTWSQTPVTQPSPRAVPAPQQLGGQDIFIKAWLDKDEVYVNEPVMMTYTLFTRLSATYKGFEKEPVTTGFWVEDFPPEKTVRRTEQFLNGQRYVVADVRKQALFPTQAGVYTLDPGTLSANVEVRSEDSFDTFFSGNVFGSRRYGLPSAFTVQVVSKIMPTDPVKVVVKALPASGKPASFTGAVGKYEIESSLDKNEVEAGNPVTFRVKISGKGNINTLQPPSVPKSDDFKIYDSSSSSTVAKERLVVEGEKVTETVIVPRKAGSYTIPPVSFSYFDPSKETYVELKTEPHTLTVTKGTEAEESAPAEPAPLLQPASKEDVDLAAKDIRYIKTVDDGKLLPATPLYKNPLYWLIDLFLVLACVMAAVLKSRRDIDTKSVHAQRFRRSHAMARGKLKAASRMLKQEKTDSFYEEVSKAVYGYFADKLNIPAQAVSREKIESTSPDASAELLNKIGKLFDELSLGRFGSAQKGQEDMKDLYDLADEVLTKFEKVRKK